MKRVNRENLGFTRVRTGTYRLLIAACEHGTQCRNCAGPAQAALAAANQDARSVAESGKTFDGKTYDPVLDGRRLTRQLGRIFECQRDGVFRTLDEIHAITGDPAPSVNARLRDLRKPRFGGYTVIARRRLPGLWEYRLLDPEGRQIDNKTMDLGLSPSLSGPVSNRAPGLRN